MTNVYLQAAEALRREATRLRNITDAADALERIGSLHQAQDEQTARLDALKVEIADAEKRLASLKQAQDSLAQENDRMLAAARDQAKSIGDAARKEAEQIITDAKRLADDMVLSAKTQAADIVGKADSHRAIALQEQRNAESSLSELGKLVRAKQEELDSLNAKLAQARAHLRQLIGEA